MSRNQNGEAPTRTEKRGVFERDIFTKFIVTDMRESEGAKWCKCLFGSAF